MGDERGMRHKRALVVLLLLLFTLLFATSASSSDDAALRLKALHPTQTVCSCDVSVFLLELTNSWKAVDGYSLWIEGIDAHSYVLSDSLVILQPGERARVYAYLRPACGTTGSFSLIAKAQSGVRKSSATLPLSLDILNCSKRSTSTLEKSDASSAVYMLYATYLFYTIICILAVAVLVVVILIVKRTAGRFGRWLKRYQFLLPLCLGLGVLFLVISAFAYPLVQQHYEQQEEPLATPEETQDTPENDTKESLFPSEVTATVLGGVLILLGVLAWYWRRRLGCATEMHKEKGKKQIKRVKEMPYKEHSAFYDLAALKGWCANLKSKETAARVKPVLKWCWMTLLLFLFLAGIAAGLYFLYPQYKADATYFLGQNASEEGEPSAASEETTIESDTLTESLSDLETKYATLEEQLNNMQEDIQTLDEKIEALTALLDELEQESSVSDTLIADVQEEIDALQKEKEALEESVVEVQDTAPLLEVIEEEKEDLPSAPSETAFKTVLIFDISLSGQIEEEGTTRFVHGLTLAKKYIELEGSYTIMIAGKNALVIKRDVSADIAVHVLRTLRPLDTQSNLGKALSAAAENMGSAPGRIVLVSDLVTTDGTDINKIRKELMKEGFDVVFLPFSSSEENGEEEQLVREETPVEESEEIEISEEGSDVEETEEDIQEETTEEKTTEDGAGEAEASETTTIFDVENETQGNFFIDVPKNTAYRIDLNTYFVDEDADLLVYTATPGDHLSTIIEENFVTLTPELDWTGETSVQFIADDTNGGIVESPVIRVVVSENTASPQSNYIPWIILGSIIVLIIVSLISGAFARKFHRDPGMPPEENE